MDVVNEIISNYRAKEKPKSYLVTLHVSKYNIYLSQENCLLKGTCICVCEINKKIKHGRVVVVKLRRKLVNINE